MPDALRLNKSQLDAVIGHARSCKPEEACGILAGASDGSGVRTVERVFLMENAEHSTTFYMLDSQEQFRVFDEMEKEGLEPVAIFHSHPHSPAVPSAHDVDLAFYPHSLYLIISLMNEQHDCHVYRIVDKKVSEVRIEIIEKTGMD